MTAPLTASAPAETQPTRAPSSTYPTLWSQLLGEYAEEIVRDAHRDFELYGLDGPEGAQ